LGDEKMTLGRFVLTIGIVFCSFTSQSRLASQALAEEQPAQKARDATPVPAGPNEPNAEPPRIYFEQTTIDLGPIAPGSSNKCEFKFQNKGKGVLEITDVGKSCGCTVTELEKKKYAPGETGTLKVTYNADHSPGVRTRHLYVSSNDPVAPRVELTIKAAIAEKVIPEPDNLSYMLRGKNADEAELTIKSLDGKPFSITKFEATGDIVTANFDANEKAEKIVLKTKVNAEKVGATTNGRIEITLTHPETSTITVPFSILLRFRTDPQAINIINAEPGKAIQKELWLLSNYDEDFEIASADSREGIIKVLGKEKLGNRYKLNLEISPPQAKNIARMFTDMLSVSTTDGEKINVTCRGFYIRKK
jgi:hypothetical protein